MKYARLLHSMLSMAALLVLSGHTPRETVCKEQDALADLRNLARGLDKYYAVYGEYPSTLEELYPDHVYYLEYFFDPWGQPYSYRNLGEDAGYELYSTGRDRAPKTLDDVIRYTPSQICTGHLPDIGYLRTVSRRDTQCSLSCVLISTVTDLLSSYHKHTGTYPETLHELNFELSDGLYSDKPSMFIDSWGRPIIYHRVGSRYELYSVGQDGIPNTSDDVVDRCPSCLNQSGEAWHWESYNRMAKDPHIDARSLARLTTASVCGLARWRMMMVESAVDSFRKFEGKLPDSLADLYADENTKTAGVYVDPWGQPYSYSRLESDKDVPVYGHHTGPLINYFYASGLGYKLFSNGADQLPNTDDDLVAGFGSRICWQHPYDEITFQQVHAAQRLLETEHAGEPTGSVVCYSPPTAEDREAEAYRATAGCSYSTTRY